MVRQCLQDADVLRYEIGFAAETSWKFKNEEQGPEWLLLNKPPFDLVEEILLQRIQHIEDTCEATEPSIFFFTGKTNFRYAIAKRKPYKDRPSNKPFHYYNIKAYLQGRYEWRQAEGLEADDLMAIEQSSSEGRTIICTRDKDLRQVSGWHFGWELGKQPQFGPTFVDGYGVIALSEDRKSVKGYGLKFFLCQCLIGDVVDTVPGLPNCGPVRALEILADTKTYTEGLQAVYEAYLASYEHPVIATDELTEQGQLLFMTRKLNEDGTPVLWNIQENYETN